MKPSLIAGTVVTVAGLLVVAGCGSTTGATAPYGAQPSATTAVQASHSDTVTISNFAFSANSVAAGSTVHVKNNDSASHTVNVNGTKIDVTVSGNGTASFVAPTTPGTYALTCDFHPSMQGTLIVTK